MVPQNHILRYYDPLPLFGRNLELYKCISILSDEDETRLILLKSKKEPKREIGNYALKYCLDRGYYKNGVYEIQIGSNFQSIFDKIGRILRLKEKPQNVHDLQQMLDDKHIALFFHSFSELLPNEISELVSILEEVLEFTSYLKILVAVDEGV